VFPGIGLSNRFKTHRRRFFSYACRVLRASGKVGSVTRGEGS
jgi:hypothetical protein